MFQNRNWYYFLPYYMPFSSLLIMGLKKCLSEAEKAKIEILHQENKSARYIGKKINRHHSTVSNFLKNPQQYGLKLKNNGRKKMHTAYERSKIRKEGSNQALSAQKIQQKAGVGGSIRTIRRVLNEERLKYQKMNKRPKMVQRHRDARIVYAHRYHNFNEWDKVFFTDEKKWNLDGPDGLAHYWHDLRKEERYFSTQHSGGASLMVWGAISMAGKLQLKIIDKKMNSDKFIDLLDDHFLPGAHSLYGEEFILQQDNAPIHSSRETKEHIQNKNIQVLPWPSNSPDLNPIENCWGWLVRKVHENVRQFNNVSELKTKIFEEWSKIDQSYIDNLVQSMPNRLALVLEKQGYPLKY